MRLNRQGARNSGCRAVLNGLLFSFIVWNPFCAFGWDGLTDSNTWSSLSVEVETSRSQLTNLMSEAAASGLNTDYASVSQVVIERFQTYAQYDRDHPEEVYQAFTNVWWHVNVPDQNYSVNLPFDEMQACLEVASNAVAELQAQLLTNIVLQAPVDFTTGTMSFGSGSCLRDGEPVFPSEFTWMPGDEDLMQAFGRMGGIYYALTDMSDSNTVKAKAVSADVTSIGDQTVSNIAFGQYFIGHAAAGWMTESYPEILDGARNFVKYDTDSPHIREWFDTLFDQYLTPVCTEQGDQPRMHLLANEPNFATREGGWLADNGVSSNTMNRYEAWIANKYSTITDLNATYGTAYADFYVARTNMTMPIATSLQGGPVWYDWCRFNMDRINDFFQFLKDGTQGSDPLSAPVTIKILGGQLANSWRDDGMDMEYLANLMDVTGADLHVIPGGATVVQPNKVDMTWTNLYALDWSEQSMMLDFYKSLHPEKPYYDSEWHGFATGKWRDFTMDRDYVRSALWLGFTHGMNCIQSWVWARKDDGNFLNVNSDFIGDILTLPTALDAYGRVMKELNAHASTVTDLVRQDRQFWIYYCGESAIQDLTYVGELEAVYESLKLLNLRVGFATPSTLSTLSASAQTVVVPPTVFVSDAGYAALQAFEQAGGAVVMVNGESLSFGKDELGFETVDRTNHTPYAAVSFNEDAFALADELGPALADLMPDLPVQIEIYDAGGTDAYGVIATQSKDAATGNSTLSLINVSQETRTVSLSLSYGNSADWKDLITGQSTAASHVMAPYDVLLLETENIQQSWEGCVAANGLSGDLSADQDEDGQTDFMEYALGGDPTNAAVQGMATELVFDSDNPVGFYHVERGYTNSGISYQTGWTTNLVTGPWSNTWDTVTSQATSDPDFKGVYSGLLADTLTPLFFRLRITVP